MTSTNYQRRVMQVLNEIAGIKNTDVKFLKVCDECGRVFDMLDEDESQEWFYGHDCEVCGDELCQECSE
jgi:hypothetical protein